MSDKDLSLKPHSIKGTENIWWYEAPKGVEIVTSYGGKACETRIISWRTIRNAFKRKDKK